VSLRSKLIRLAHENPSIRPDVLRLIARYQPSRTEVTVNGRGSFTVRIPVTGNITQSDWKAGMVDMAREINAILKFLQERGYAARAGGTSLDASSPASGFVNRVVVSLKGASPTPDELRPILQDLPGVYVR